LIGYAQEIPERCAAVSIPEVSVLNIESAAVDEVVVELV
jgi:hypothetical protein